MTIDQKTKDKFKEFCTRIYNGPDTHTHFVLNDFEIDGVKEFEREGPDGQPLWEFFAANYQPDNTYNILELFDSVQPDYGVEIHGYDDFYVIKPIA